VFEIEVANRLPAPRPEDPRMRRAVEQILAEANIQDAEISIAIVGDEEMHLLNRRHLQHDYPTDVLSFVLHCEPLRLEGEVVVSYDTAARQAERYGWSAEDELLLYVVHGALHLVGHEDDAPEQREQMRRREVQIMQGFDITPRYNTTAHDDQITPRNDQITPPNDTGDCSHAASGGRIG